MRLLNCPDYVDQPYRVGTLPLSQKMKRNGTRLQLQDSIFEERLAVQYKVELRKYWESLKRYKETTGKKGHPGAFMGGLDMP